MSEYGAMALSPRLQTFLHKKHGNVLLAPRVDQRFFSPSSSVIVRPRVRNISTGPLPSPMGKTKPVVRKLLSPKSRCRNNARCNPEVPPFIFLVSDDRQMPMASKLPCACGPYAQTPAS